MNALNIKHTRAHQGLARVYHLKSQRKAAYDEMTKLIEKARNNASAYEKRSEYCDRDMAKSDLTMATQLDPLRTYPYRYRAAGNKYNHLFFCVWFTFVDNFKVLFTLKLSARPFCACDSFVFVVSWLFFFLFFFNRKKLILSFDIS